MKIRLLVALLLLAAPLAAQDVARYLVFETQQPGFCVDDVPRIFMVMDASSQETCGTGGGVANAPCACIDGSVVALATSPGAYVLSGGRAGGQTVIGDTGTAGPLLLQGSASGTPSSSKITLATDITIEKSSGASDRIVLDATGMDFEAASGDFFDFEQAGDTLVARIDPAQGNMKLQGSIQLGSTSDGSAARLYRDSNDEICHDTDAGDDCDAGENDLADAGGSFDIKPEEMAIISGATRTTDGLFSTLHFVDGATDRVTSSFIIPPALRGRNFELRVAYTTSTTGCNVRLRTNYGFFQEGDSISSSTQVDVTVANSSSATTLKYQQLVASAASPSTDAVGLVDFRRLGTDLADTCSGTFNLVSIHVIVI